jgi:Tfp pilus assembly protein PilX
MARHHRRGSALLTTIIFLMVMFTLGAALLSLTTSNLTRSERDMLRAQALDVAEAGVEKAIYYLRNTSPANSGGNTGTTDGTADGATNGSWRTAGWTETLTSNGSYTFSVTDGTGVDAGKLVILCTGTTTTGTKSVSRRLRVLITRVEENISPWNNVIFGGVGQAGRSINGNVVMRGGVHLLGDGEPYTDTDGDGHWDDNESYTDSNGNGQYDVGEPFTDTDGDGRRDAREPFVDMNGNGVCDPPLTVTDLAQEMGGTANIGNNYDIMPSDLKALIPSCPTTSYGGETVESLSAKLRVKHGSVAISGTATVGNQNAAGGSPAYKETMNGTYVNDGYGGNSGAANVYSDNGTAHKYDCKDLVTFPDIIATPTSAIHGIVYSNHEAYLASPFEALQITGPINLQPDQNYGPISDAFGNHHDPRDRQRDRQHQLQPGQRQRRRHVPLRGPRYAVFHRQRLRAHKRALDRHVPDHRCDGHHRAAQPGAGDGQRRLAAQDDGRLLRAGADRQPEAERDLRHVRDQLLLDAERAAHVPGAGAVEQPASGHARLDTDLDHHHPGE